MFCTPAQVRPPVMSGDEVGVPWLGGTDGSHIIALDKASGAFLAQYRVTLDPGWKDLRGMYVVAGANGDADTLIWVDGRRLVADGEPTTFETVPRTSLVDALRHEADSAFGSAQSSPTGETDVAKSLVQVAGMLRHRSLVMLFSDLLTDPEPVKQAFQRGAIMAM